MKRGIFFTLYKRPYKQMKPRLKKKGRINKQINFSHICLIKELFDYYKKPVKGLHLVFRVPCVKI